jgi:hypothetical protein
MVDAVDSLLNNIVDLYVYYRWIPTNQIPTPIGAEIRQIRPESGDVRQPSPDSGGTVPDSGQPSRSSWISGYLGWTLAESLAIWPES